MNVLNPDVDFMGQFFFAGCLRDLDLFTNFTALTCIFLELFLCAGLCQDMFRITLGPIWVTAIDTRFLKATDVWADVLISILNLHPCDTHKAETTWRISVPPLPMRLLFLSLCFFISSPPAVLLFLTPSSLPSLSFDPPPLFFSPYCQFLYLQAAHIFKRDSHYRPWQAAALSSGCLFRFVWMQTRTPAHTQTHTHTRRPITPHTSCVHEHALSHISCVSHRCRTQHRIKPQTRCLNRARNSIGV